MSSWLQELRQKLQSIEIIQKAITSELLAHQDNQSQQALSQNRINNFGQMIQGISKGVLTFTTEEAQMKKSQLSIIQGSRSLKGSENKKVTDVVWENFYERAKNIKEIYKKPETVHLSNTIESFRQSVFKPPFKHPEFSLQESNGKYVDLHGLYLQYINLNAVFQTGDKFHDYLWYLQNLDKFDDYSLPKKLKHESKYSVYLSSLLNYLIDYLKRSRPLLEINQKQIQWHQVFSQRYQQDRIPGWERSHDNFDIQNCQYCEACKKLFVSNEAFVNHLIGKKHLKAQAKRQLQKDTQTKGQQAAKKEYLKQHEQRKKTLAYLQFQISKLREQLAKNFYDTMNLVRKKQTKGYEAIDDISQDSDVTEQENDAPIYNPKNLPMGWDGKPIPYWLYKLHGLGNQFKCQICGNYSYWGRRAFQMHFQQWRHNYGMKCLKIPNTIHFKDVTSIVDARALHQKLMRESKQAKFRPDIEEEFEDNQGNLLNRKTYFDMKKQGLIE